MIKAIAVTGPTGSGKTALSISLAEALSGEIISCDSMQIYKGMDIGTAKATAEEQKRAVHHLIDIVSPLELFSVEDYRELAVKAAGDISARGRLPIFTGGTGLYVDSLLRAPQSSVPKRNIGGMSLRRAEHTEEYKEELWQRLLAVDPDSANSIHKNNVRRVERALEIYESTGMTKTELDRLSRIPARDISLGILTLDFHNRELLYSRIDRRVDEMMGSGLLSEAEALYRAGMLAPDTTASQAIGYKELVKHIEGRITLEDAVEEIKLSSRRYAKRQLTWFRRCNDAHRLFLDGISGELRPAEELLSEALAFSKAFLSDSV